MSAWLLAFACLAGHAKRNLPRYIQPIRHHGRVYLARVEIGGKGFRGLLIAESAKDNAKVWETEVFRGTYDPTLERDVQEVHFTELRVRGQTLRAKDERGRRYEVRLSDGTPVGS